MIGEGTQGPCKVPVRSEQGRLNLRAAQHRIHPRSEGRSSLTEAQREGKFPRRTSPAQQPARQARLTLASAALLALPDSRRARCSRKSGQGGNQPQPRSGEEISRPKPASGPGQQGLRTGGREAQAQRGPGAPCSREAAPIKERSYQKRRGQRGWSLDPPAWHSEQGGWR